MILPNGITHHPREWPPIAIDSGGLVRIDSSVRQNREYEISETPVREVMPALPGVWQQFDLLFEIARERVVDDPADRKRKLTFPAPVITRAVHGGDPVDPTIIVVPNLETRVSRRDASPLRILGCNFGMALAGEEATRTRYVLELQSYGMMAIDRGLGSVDLWVGEVGSKIVVPTGSDTTLYNLGSMDDPLIALELADPRASQALPLARVWGPILLAYYDDMEVVFRINPLYLNSGIPNAGTIIDENVLAQIGHEIHLARLSRLGLGAFLFEQLTQNTALIESFSKFGIRLRRANTEAVIEPLEGNVGPRLFVARSLARAARSGTALHQFFFPEAAVETKAESETGQTTWPAPAPRAAPSREPRELNRPLLIVVEGAGDWVGKAYRTMFEKKKPGSLSVFYADDSRWNGVPEWANPDSDKYDLREWEVYLDKSKVGDYRFYSHLRPDAVFVATPDFTHAVVASHWIGKTPIVFVEKPFDSHIVNYQRLRSRLSNERWQTEVVGLDHYQFYAAPLQKMRERVRALVGDSLRSVDCVFTESAAIELGRERSLQYGLSLDLLPHLLAILTYFGDIKTIDEISVPSVWRYFPLKAENPKTKESRDIADSFVNETAALIHFTFEDHSGTGRRVPCRVLVGKGLKREIKFVDVTGAGEAANTLRIDLRSSPMEGYPTEQHYPWRSLFFIAGRFRPAGALDVLDPYRLREHIHILTDEKGPIDEKEPIKEPIDRDRYEMLLDDLLNGTNRAAPASLSMSQGGDVVMVLDRIWWAIQNSRPWQTHDFKNLEPMSVFL